MKKLVLSVVVVLSLFAMKTTVAQSSGGASDPHFSQFYGAPLLLNPALTGAFDCNVRVGAIYRNQWGSILKDEVIPNYSTPSFYLDFRTNKGFMEGDAFGFGLTVMNDMVGQSKFMTNRFGLAIAYHKALDRRAEHMLTLGFKSEIWQRSIDYRGLQWGAQWNGNSYDEYRPSGEYLINNNFLFWDVSTGLLYTGKFGERTNGYLGVAWDHINRPTESFLGDKNVKLPWRFVAHGGFRFPIKGRVDLQPKFIYMNQGVSHELNVGTDVRFAFEERDPDGNNFKIGAMFRVVGGDKKFGDKVLNPEAVIINAGVEFSKITIGAAYDINISKLVQGSRAQGAFEIYANWVGCFNKRGPKTIFCPKF